MGGRRVGRGGEGASVTPVGEVGRGGEGASVFTHFIRCPGHALIEPLPNN